jgi:hypothetical protein
LPRASNGHRPRSTRIELIFLETIAPSDALGKPSG